MANVKHIFCRLSRSVLMLLVLAQVPAKSEPIKSTPCPVPLNSADPIGWLLQHKESWPKEVVTTAAVEFPLLFDGKLGGSVKRPAGAIVQLIDITTDHITVGFNSNTARIPENQTNLRELAAHLMALQAKKEGDIPTPTVAPKVSPSPVSAEIEKTDYQVKESSHYELPKRLVGVHPRLFADERRIEGIKKLIDSNPRYTEMWKRFKKSADDIRPVKKGVTFESMAAKSMDERGAEEGLFILVAAYRLSGEPAFLEKARLLVRFWSEAPDSWFDSFGADNLLCGMALYYDWCWQDLSPEEREATGKLLLKWGFLQKDWMEKTHFRSMLSNQWQIRVASIGLCALASDDTTGKAAELTDYVTHEIQRMEDVQGDDGVTIEGVGYGQYGNQFLMRYADVAKDLLGVNFYRDKWWYNNGLYQLYMTTPRNSWHSKQRVQSVPSTFWMNVDIGDCPRYNWYGPDDLLRGIAKETRNGYAQWLADAIDEGKHESGDSFFNLLRYDDSIPPLSPSGLPTLHWFGNTGLVSARSDWSGNESMVTFICGPYYGHKGVDSATEDLGGGHSHPNANAFSIFGAGEWLVSYPGYTRRMADYENTLIVNGKGQLDQTEKAGFWDSMPLITKRLHPKMLKILSTPDLDQMTGDATPSYFGLKKYIRHLLFIKPNTLIVLDDIASDSDDKYKLLFHCEADSSKGAKQPDGSYLVSGEKALLLIHPLTLENVTSTGGPFSLHDRHTDKTTSKFCLTLENQGREWRNAIAFTWSDGMKAPDTVSLVRNGNTWLFKVGENTYAFDWGADTLVKNPR